MYITFKTKKLEKQFNQGALLDRIHGVKRATKIRLRMQELRAAKTLYDFWPPKSPPSRCHELNKGKRKGQISVDLDHPYRLLFIPAHVPQATYVDGSLNWTKVTAIIIIGVEDTHE